MAVLERRYRHHNVNNGAVGTVSSFAKLTAVIDAELGLNNYINAAINHTTVGQAVWFNQRQRLRCR